MSERFERRLQCRQPWTAEELAKLKLLAGKDMALKAIAKAMTRSEQSNKDRAEARRHRHRQAPTGFGNARPPKRHSLALP